MGGNLSLMSSLVGTGALPPPTGQYILFLEGLDSLPFDMANPFQKLVRLLTKSIE